VPDLLGPDLRLLIVTINPSTRSAEVGHSFASPGNPFWRLVHAAGLTPVLLTPPEEHRLLEWGIGMITTVRRPTGAASELSPAERRAGADAVRATVGTHRPGVVALLGLTLYPLFFPKARSPGPGLKAVEIASSPVFVLPNPSGRNQAYPSFDSKLEWYRALAELIGPPDERPEGRPDGPPDDGPPG